MNYVRNRHLGIGLFLLCLVSGILLGIPTGILIYHFYNVQPAEELNIKYIELYATLIAGISAFISAFLLYFTLRSQTKDQLKNEFERRYYQLIHFHCQNVAEMNFCDPDNTRKLNCQGKDVFRKIHRQIEQAIMDIAPFFKRIEPENYYKDKSALEDDAKNTHIVKNNIDLNLLNQYNIAYLLVFFGLDKQGKAILNNMLQKKYKPDFFTPILDLCENRKTAYSKMILSFCTGKKEQYYSGHQIRLGHYFRHLFQTVVFVNDSSLFTYEEKYDYIRILRTHMSPYEQSVFFFNSLSSLGRGWEIGQSLKGNKLNYQLITKYDLIRNIPSAFSQVNAQTDFIYPLVEYEWKEEVEEKKVQRKRYK